MDQKKTDQARKGKRESLFACTPKAHEYKYSSIPAKKKKLTLPTPAQAKMLGSLRKEREVEMENMRNALERTRQDKRDEEMREMAKVRKMQQDEFERLANKKRANYEKMMKWRVENETNLKFKEQQRLDQVCACVDLAGKKKKKNLGDL